MKSLIWFIVYNEVLTLVSKYYTKVHGYIFNKCANYHFGIYMFKVKVYWSFRGQWLDISLWLVIITVVLMVILPLFRLLSFASFSQNKLFLGDFLVFIFSFERDPSANNNKYFQIFTKNCQIECKLIFTLPLEGVGCIHYLTQKRYAFPFWIFV